MIMWTDGKGANPEAHAIGGFLCIRHAAIDSGAEIGDHQAFLYQHDLVPPPPQRS